MNDIYDTNDIKNFLTNIITYKKFEEIQNGDTLILYFYLNWYNLGQILKNDNYIYFNTNIKGKIHKDDFNNLYKYMEIGTISNNNIIELYEYWKNINYNKRAETLKRYKFKKSYFNGLVCSTF